MANVTWNPADISNGTLSGGNLIVTGGGSNGGVRATDRQLTGMFYWETTFPANNSSLGVGIANSLTVLSTAYSSIVNICYLWTNGMVYFDPAATTISLGSLTAGGTTGFAWRGDLNQIWFRICPAGNWNASATANPSTGVGGLSLAGHAFGTAFPIYPVVVYNGSGTGRVITANFGDSAFSGVVPAGFTSGFTAGASIPNNEVATQVALEDWRVPIPDMRATQMAIEDWRVPDPYAQITQVSAEHWFTSNPPAQITQVVVEHWASIAAAPSTSGPMVTMIY